MRHVMTRAGVSPSYPPFILAVTLKDSLLTGEWCNLVPLEGIIAMSVQLSVQDPSPQSEWLPAVMLAMLLATTGFEIAYLVAFPHTVEAHVAKSSRDIQARR